MARYFMSDEGEWADSTKPVSSDGERMTVVLGAAIEHPEEQQYACSDSYEVEQYMDELETQLAEARAKIEKIRAFNASAHIARTYAGYRRRIREILGDGED